MLAYLQKKERSKLICTAQAIIVVIVWYLEIQPPVQSVTCTTKVVRSNPVDGEVYLIQH
jgi:hypothetical protein